MTINKSFQIRIWHFDLIIILIINNVTGWPVTLLDLHLSDPINNNVYVFLWDNYEVSVKPKMRLWLISHSTRAQTDVQCFWIWFTYELQLHLWMQWWRVVTDSGFKRCSWVHAVMWFPLKNCVCFSCSDF